MGLRDIIIRNNRIEGVSRDYKEQSAILVTYASGTLILNNDGTMNVTKAAAGYAGNRMNQTDNRAQFDNSGTLTISGQLNGRLTVGASNDVIIPNNLTYATDPRVDPTSDDVMGIISEADVMVDDAAPHNVEVDACIMALNTSFMVENWNTMAAKGTLTVYGGIIQDERGPVGTFNGATGNKVSGYSKSYGYDARLLSTPPPFMPTTGDYVTLSWEEN
jgi:hypothetical protein